MREPRRRVLEAPVRITTSELRRYVRYELSTATPWRQPTVELIVTRTSNPSAGSVEKDAENAVVISAALMDAGVSGHMLLPNIVHLKGSSANETGIRIVVEEAPWAQINGAA